jgi:23S rRNA-/tRNA-specific pseudouridylate synthase
MFAVMCHSLNGLTPATICRLVHRLDRYVSGAMVLARMDDSAAWLASCLQYKSDEVIIAIRMMTCLVDTSCGMKGQCEQLP